MSQYEHKKKNRVLLLAKIQTGFTHPYEITTITTKNIIFEMMLFKTLDNMQQRTVMPERQETNKMNSRDCLAYCFRRISRSQRGNQSEVSLSYGD